MMKETHAFTAGEFREPVEVWEITSTTPDGSGGQTIVWGLKLAIVWCLMENEESRENFADNATARIRTFNKFRFTTWYRNDITTENQIRYQGIIYNIRGTTNLLMRNKFLQITAESGVEQ